MHDRTLKRIFILAGIALILWVLYLLKPVVIPFVAAFLIAYLFSPLVEKINKFLPRWLAIAIVFIVIGVGVTWAMWFVVPLVWKQLIYARDSIPEGIHWINSTFLPWVSHKFNVEAKIVYNYNINFDNRLTTQNNIVIPVTIKQESNYIIYYY